MNTQENNLSLREVLARNGIEHSGDMHRKALQKRLEQRLAAMVTEKEQGSTLAGIEVTYIDL